MVPMTAPPASVSVAVSSVADDAFLVSSQAKVEYLHPAIGGQKNVSGLYIAMNDSFGMGGSQALRDPGSELGRLTPRQRTAAEAFAQGLAFKQFGDDVVNFLLRPNVVQDQNVGVGQCRDGQRLAPKPGQRLRVIRQMLGKNFNGDIAIQASIAGAIHFAHAARANGRNKLIRAEASTRGERHGL